ncbi:hypothetical protein EYF80_042575 [Liparis tanakae]|uniref:Uncharacterized protein n=1 Tax=Liparis tanakae TaxID=230148 RepID=A0A4Z2G148_9TELE|nr:hypothetical protein EYF80_042575 [Liparis tanakae]
MTWNRPKDDGVTGWIREKESDEGRGQRAVHYVLAADPRHDLGLDLGPLGHLQQQPVHGEVPPGEGCVSGPQSQRGTDIIGPVSDIEHPLKGSTAALLLPARQILPEDHLLAHVVRATGARVGVKGEQDQAAGCVETRRVGENLGEKVAHAGALQPGLDEVHVGVGDHRQLKVLLVALQVLEEGREARRGRDLLQRRTDGVLGHALLRHVHQDLLHVLVVVALPVAVSQPIRKPLTRQSAHHGVVAVLVDDGLVEVEQHEEALLMLRRRGGLIGRSRHVGCVEETRQKAGEGGRGEEGERKGEEWLDLASSGFASSGFASSGFASSGFASSAFASSAFASSAFTSSAFASGRRMTLPMFWRSCMRLMASAT